MNFSINSLFVLFVIVAVFIAANLQFDDWSYAEPPGSRQFGQRAYDGWLKRDRGWPFTFESEFKTEGGEFINGSLKPWETTEEKDRYGLIGNIFAFAFAILWWTAAMLTKPLAVSVKPIRRRSDPM